MDPIGAQNSEQIGISFELLRLDARNVSGQRLLVMEWIDALGPASDAAALRKANLKPSDIMRTAMETFGHQIFSTGHVHCDPHPGNLLVRLSPPGSAQRLDYRI